LIEIELGDLKKVGKEFAESLGQRLKTDVSLKGRLQVKHALHQLGFSEEYRVLAEHHTVRIVKVGEKYRPIERKGAVPPPSQSLPYFFPG
jgi:hypothetical protein